MSEYSSNPSCPRKIYLNFNGATVTNTWWNELTGLPEMVSAPYANSAAKYDIWARVAQDFASFDVDVTTERPAKLNYTDDTSPYGMEVIIADNDWYNEVFGHAIGGIAYLFTFKRSAAIPCYVFGSSLGNNTKYVADAVVHEVGHTLGLYHHGHGEDEYYGGHGVWAPIMGVGYHKSITQWSDGTYTSASRPDQKDIDVINLSYLPFTDDGHSQGTLIGFEKNLPLNEKQTKSLKGTVSSQNYMGVFKETFAKGVVNVKVTPAPLSSSLVAKLEVKRNGELIGTYRSDLAINWSIATELAVDEAEYEFIVSGASWRNFEENGFSRYGSVGEYNIAFEYVQEVEAPKEDGGVAYYPLEPRRVHDSRPKRPITASTVKIKTNLGPEAKAAHVVLTTTETKGAGYFTAWGSGSRPDSSVLNSDRHNQTIANAFTVKLDEEGNFSVYTSGGDHIIVDVMGYYK